MLNSISVKIGGPAGSGVFTIGLLLSKYFQKLNLYVAYTTDYPSLIKGGHNTCCIRTSEKQIYSEDKTHDVVVALDSLTVKEDLKYLKKGGILICDEKLNVDIKGVTVIKVPYEVLLSDLNPRYQNTVAFGVLVGVMSSHIDAIKVAIRSHFKKKDVNVQEENIIAATNGYEFARELCHREGKCFIERIVGFKKNSNTVFMTGNDASALGALKAGVKFVAEYPMTPSSSFLSFFAAHELDYNITTKHTEDEIAAMNMVVGAAAAGVRTMTATSGGGFALMNEALGMAGIAENPCVIFECQRAGPSTGIPTYTDQGDLKFVINSSQGEFPLVVLAPGDIEECFEIGFEAFNIADLTQTPVVVLLDKHISAAQLTCTRFNTKKLKINRGEYIPLSNKSLPKDYKRYKFTKSGISPRICLGHPGGQYVNSSYEHDETGWTCEDGKNHEMMQEKRFKKLESIPSKFLRPLKYGPEKADLTLVGWGSTKGAILDAMSVLENEGFNVNYYHFVGMNPMDSKFVEKELSSCKNLMILEGNFTAQLRDIIREKTGVYIENTYLKYDGRPFFYEDIVDRIKKELGKTKVKKTVKKTTKKVVKKATKKVGGKK